MLTNKKGFSLVELIIVIVILGILVGVGVPSLMSYVKKANIGVDQANAALIMRNIQISYATELAKGATVTEATVITNAKALMQGGKWPTPKSVSGTFFYKINGTGELATFEVGVSATNAMVSSDTASVLPDSTAYTGTGSATALTNAAS